MTIYNNMLISKTCERLLSTLFNTLQFVPYLGLFFAPPPLNAFSGEKISACRLYCTVS